jgi:nucleotide-binding universal stress UspA family protein
MEHVIITTDLSLESYTAFQPPAQQLYLRPGTKVTLLSVIEAPVLIGDPTDIFVTFGDMDEILAQQEQKGREKLQQLATEYFPGTTVQAVILRSTADVADSISSFAKQEKASLLVMASHGRRGFRRFFVGSITEAVLRLSAIPVLVIPMHS